METSVSSLQVLFTSRMNFSLTDHYDCDNEPHTCSEGTRDLVLSESCAMHEELLDSIKSQIFHLQHYITACPLF